MLLLFKIFGRIYQTSHLVLDFSVLGAFAFEFSLFVCYKSVQIFCLFLSKFHNFCISRICSFYPCYLISGHTIAFSTLL